MKTKNLLLFLFIICPFFISAQNNFFEKFSAMDEVTSINMSKSMLQMIPDMKINANGVDLSSMINQLEKVHILTTSDSKIKNQMKEEVSLTSYEEMMEIKEGKSKVNIYTKTKNNSIKELIMIVEEAKELVIIQLKGNFTMEDIRKLAK